MDSIKLTGKVSYTLRDKDGVVKDSWNGDNLVVTSGKQALATWLAASSQSGPFMPYIAIGTSSSIVASSDTTLGTEVARALGTVSSVGPIFRVEYVFPAGVGTGTITEAGLFSAASAGTMLSRQVFTARPKDEGDELTILWQIVVG